MKIRNLLIAASLVVWQHNSLHAQVHDLIVPPTDTFAGQTYEDALRGFWGWAFAFPGDGGRNTHPLMDADGASMGINNDGPIYYLSKSWRKVSAFPGEELDSIDLQELRSIHVRPDQAIFAPLNGWVSWLYPTTPDEWNDPERVADWLVGKNEGSDFTIRLKVDGEDIHIDNSLESPYFAHTGTFEVDFPDDSAFLPVLGISEDSENHPSNYQTPNRVPLIINQDFMALIKPLSIGEHTVEIYGQTYEGGEEPVFTTDVAYRTIVATAGDANFDGKVEFSDFLALSENFGQPGGWQQGDFDLDGTVDFPDFLALAANYETSAVAAVPEPSALSLVGIACLGLLSFRRPS